jgi:hypothetical protein
MFYFGNQNSEFGQELKVPTSFRVGDINRNRLYGLPYRTAPVKTSAVASAGLSTRASTNAKGSDEIFSGSKIKFVATFINLGNAAISGLNPLGIIYQGNKRLNLSQSKQIVKEVFERSFNGVNVISSSGGGALEVNFTIPQDWNSVEDLRAFCVNLIQKATGYSVETAFLTITRKATGEKVNDPIRNSPSERNEKNEKELSSFFDNLALGLGLSTPVTIALAVGLGIYILKK